MNRILSICKHIGCNALIPTPGYCIKHHTDERKIKRGAWDIIDERKSSEDKAFYNNAKWHFVSSMHRQKEPLCRRCKKEGRITPGEMTHHEPDRRILIARGDSPYDDTFLVTLCNSCHNKLINKKKHF